MSGGDGDGPPGASRGDSLLLGAAARRPVAATARAGGALVGRAAAGVYGFGGHRARQRHAQRAGRVAECDQEQQSPTACARKEHAGASIWDRGQGSKSLLYLKYHAESPWCCWSDWPVTSDGLGDGNLTARRGLARDRTATTDIGRRQLNPVPSPSWKDDSAASADTPGSASCTATRSTSGS
jgi:hypothetical protein